MNRKNKLKNKLISLCITLIRTGMKMFNCHENNVEMQKKVIIMTRNRL